jgi:sulfite exporter TauE/SafE
MNELEYATIISFALLGSIGHCIGMCGGFIITYTTAKISPEQSKFSQSFYHLLYNLGRVSTYTLFGALFGYFGSLWDVTPLTRAIMFLVAGVMMILMGLSFAGKLNFLTKIEVPIAHFSWFKKIFTSQLSAATPKSFFILGFINGLIPCGLVYAMLVTATTTESILGGALVMLLFGIFTIPSLFTFAFVVGLFSQNKFRALMIKIAAITIIFFGAWTVNKAYLQYDYWLNSPKTEEVTEMKCGANMKCGAGKCGMGKCGSK